MATKSRRLPPNTPRDEMGRFCRGEQSLRRELGTAKYLNIAMDGEDVGRDPLYQDFLERQRSIRAEETNYRL